MVQPLTQCKKDGTRYVRPPAVETQIGADLGKDIATLRRRLLVTDIASPDYVRSECLVHFIRDALRKGDEDRLNELLPILLGRGESILKATVSSSIPTADEVRQEVLSEFSEMLASDGKGDRPDELDIYECRFNLAFRALRIDVVNREIRRLERTADIPSYKDDLEPCSHEEDTFARVSEKFRTPATQEDYVFRRELWEAIEDLPFDQRKALVLCKVLGYKVESKDPAEITAATLCNCTGRTIRNRLSQAAAKLSRFKEDL